MNVEDDGVTTEMRAKSARTPFRPLLLALSLEGEL